MQKKTKCWSVLLLAGLLGSGSEAFEDRFKAADAQAASARKAAQKDAEDAMKSSKMPYGELPAALAELKANGNCSPAEFYAMYNTLWRLLNPGTAKKNADTVAAVTRTLEGVPQAAVGPNNKLSPIKEPLAALKLVHDCALTTTLPADRIEKHPSADLFPGAVPATAPRVERELTIDLAHCGYIGTGLYAPAGETITVRVPAQLAQAGAKVVIGLHQATLDLVRHKSIRRAPKIDRSFDISAAEIRCVSAFGGLVYIHLPAPNADVNLKKGDYLGPTPWAPAPHPVAIRIDGAVEAPVFQLGKTDPAAWKQRIRNRPAPFAELGTDQIVFTLPSEFVRELENPAEVLETWNEILASAAALAGTAQPRPNPIRFLIDAHVNWGAAYASYPIVAPYGWVDAIVEGKANWGHVHEIGHLHQQRAWTFYGCGEVTVNLFSLYALETVYGDVSRRQPQNLANTLKEWFGQPKADRTWAGKGHPGKLTCYMQLINEFGWVPLIEVIHSYRPELDQWNNPKAVGELACASEFVVRLSKQTGRNLYPFFDDWGLPLDPAAGARVADLPVWNPNAPANQGS
ncbi:M60 family metallopeptidase [Pontiella sp.]|uniref:M60 family metallopeptidase n=1 Tax=Pontiella sp. TaxID=2837462 RepID=UPI00356818CE